MIAEVYGEGIAVCTAVIGARRFIGQALVTALRCEIGSDFPRPIVDHDLARFGAIHSFAQIFRGFPGFMK